eukprot:7410246-Heterocapsa_arctica.AAC.1
MVEAPLERAQGLLELVQLITVMAIEVVPIGLRRGVVVDVHKGVVVVGRVGWSGCLLVVVVVEGEHVAPSARHQSLSRVLIRNGVDPDLSEQPLVRHVGEDNTGEVVVEAVEAELFNARVTVVLVLLVDQPLLQGVVRQDVAGVRVAVHLSRVCRRGAEDVDVGD